MNQIYDAIAAGNGWLNGIVWGVPALVLLMGAGIILTVGLKGFRFRKFGYAMKNTIGKMFSKQAAKEGEVTPFQALTTALAATVGTGNIAGITTAVTLGGAGSFCRWQGECFTVPGVSVKVTDTNGAGDTFLGAVLSRLSRRGGRPLEGLTGAELRDILDFANRAAALTCARSGAIPAMPLLDELSDK